MSKMTGLSIKCDDCGGYVDDWTAYYWRHVLKKWLCLACIYPKAKRGTGEGADGE